MSIKQGIFIQVSKVNKYNGIPDIPRQQTDLVSGFPKGGGII